jgi:DNA-binding beta-propeller fold protein YncE
VFDDGSWFVVDRSARVQKFSPEDKPLFQWTMAQRLDGNPKDITALPDGNLLVCNTHYGVVLKTTPDGKVLAQWGGSSPAPGDFVAPMAAAVDEKVGAAYIADYGFSEEHSRMQKFSLDGRFLKAWGKFGTEPGEFRRPCGVCVGLDGSVYVTDAVNHRVQRFDSEGGLLNVFGRCGDAPGELRYPYDIAGDAAGRLYVVEFGNHRISVFDEQGTFLRFIGGPGKNAPGLFNEPWSLEIDRKRGRLLVSDTSGGRVQVIALKELFLAEKKW